MKLNFLTLRRLYSSQDRIKPKICIIGSGPSGFYAAQHLIKKMNICQIDIFDRFPVPFGLVRFGVAPDHPEVKNVINTFTKTAKNPNVRFFGNINLGSDISLDDLRNSYHIVLLAYGAEQSRKLEVPGEYLKNCIEARQIVGWYNGIPWDSDLKIDLSGEDVVIFGQGNVAIDVARILLTPVDKLKCTDITQHALESLCLSKVKRVHLIGRRGPLQAAYTIKELREILKLKGCNTIWRKQDFIGVTEYVPSLPRPRKRITELMLKSLEEKQSLDVSREFKPVFFRSPLEIFGKSQVEGVVLGVNKLEGSDIFKQTAILTGTRETINCQLAIPSIGYKSLPADDKIPFDSEKGVVKNTHFKIDKGLYASGWLATGPTGVILTTMSNAFEVAEIILEDLSRDNLLCHAKGGFEDLVDVLSKKNVQIVTWEGWEKIDKKEQEMGAKVGKPREKIVNIKEMLEIAAL